MALIITSSVTVRSVIVSTMAMATSTSIIAIIVIIMASMGGIKLSMVTLVLASMIILLSPSPLLETSIWFPTTVLAPIGSTASVVASVILYCNNYLPLHTVLLVQGEGEVVETVVLVWIYLYLSFLLYLLCS